MSMMDGIITIVRATSGQMRDTAQLLMDKGIAPETALRVSEILPNEAVCQQVEKRLGNLSASDFTRDLASLNDEGSRALIN